MSCPAVVSVVTPGPPGVGLPSGVGLANYAVVKDGNTPYLYKLIQLEQVGLPQALGITDSPTFAGLTLSGLANQAVGIVTSGTNGALTRVAIGTGLSIVNGALVASGSAGTNLSYDANTRTIASSTGDDVVLPLATNSTPGLMPAASQAAILALGTAAQASVTDFATAAQGAKADTAVQPATLASVATSGAYADLSGRPTLGTAAATDATAYATAAQGALATTAIQPNDSRLTDAREWTADTISQAEAEEGTATTRRAWTAQRWRQAAATWWESVASSVGRTLVAAADQAAARAAIGAASTATFTDLAAGLVPASGGGTTNFLRADGLFAAPSSGGTPGGTTGQVQYNNAGAFAGIANSSVNPATGAVSVADITVSGLLQAGHIHGNLAGSLYAHVKNVSGGALAVGTPLRITGTVGDTTTLEVEAADATSSATMPAFFVLAEALEANGQGHATVAGEIQGLNTSGLTAATPLWVPVGGGVVTSTRPSANAQQVATVGRVHGSTGSIHVLPWPVEGQLSSSAPANLASTAAAGSSGQASRADHVHQFQPEALIIELSDQDTANTTPKTLRTVQYWQTNYTLLEPGVWSARVAPTGAAMQFDIRINGTSIFQTLPTIDAAENSSATAAVPAVFSSAFIASGNLIPAGSVLSFHLTQSGTGGGVELHYSSDVRRAS